MSTSHEVINRQNVYGNSLEKVIIHNDLSVLSPIEKVEHIINVCNTLHLNPLTKPIQLIKFQGKEIPYFTKDATEQLRKNNKVSITSIESKMLDGSIYIVTAHAETPDGRTDAATGATSIKGLSGDNLCNAILKAETKAKRRVTLSICGLGFIDECEAESIPGAQKIKVETIDEIKKLEVKNEFEIDETLRNDYLNDIRSSDSIDELQEKFKIAIIELKKFNDKEGIEKLIKEKDKRKSELVVKEFNDEINFETGEIQ